MPLSNFKDHNIDDYLIINMLTKTQFNKINKEPPLQDNINLCLFLGTSGLTDMQNLP